MIVYTNDGEIFVKCTKEKLAMSLSFSHANRVYWHNIKNKPKYNSIIGTACIEVESEATYKPFLEVLEKVGDYITCETIDILLNKGVITWYGHSNEYLEDIPDYYNNLE